MLTDLSLTGFKAFKRFDEPLRIRPLTVICGRNSCGKSSILQSLLLLKQSHNSEPREEALLLNGPYGEFGYFRSLCHGLPESRSAAFSVALGFSLPDSRCELDFTFRRKAVTPGTNPATVVSRLGWKGKDSAGGSLRLRGNSHILPKKAGLAVPPPEGFEYKSPARVVFQNFIPSAVEVALTPIEGTSDSEHLTAFRGRIPFSLASPVEDLNQALRQLSRELKNLRYLGPLRASPRQAYLLLDSPYQELQNDGSNAAHVLFTHREQDVCFDGEVMPLVEAVNRAIAMVGLGQRVRPRQVGPSLYQIAVHLLGNPKKEVTIADVGFGFSQFIPIALRVLLAPAASVVLLEQPEIHLHPSSRGSLIDVLLASVNDSRRLVVETHSTELINRLRLRVLENPELAEMINIVFVNQPIDDEGATIQQLSLDRNGMLSEWPEGFCDESENTARQIIQARIAASKSS